MPQRNAVLATDPRTVGIEAARPLSVQYRTAHALVGSIDAGPCHNVVAHSLGGLVQSFPEPSPLDVGHAKRLMTAVAAPAAARDVLLIALHHRSHAVIEQPKVTAESLPLVGIHQLI
jgi:hypothetical protein